MIQIGVKQGRALARDFVVRQARGLSRSADRHQALAEADARPRLQALKLALAERLAQRSGAAGRHLAIDLDPACALWQLALSGGLVYRETTVAGQLSAVATLGLWWRLDERLRPQAAAGTLPLCGEPTPAHARAWAEAPWQRDFAQASARMRAAWPQARYALGRALATGPTPQALRALGDAVAPVQSGEQLRRFVHQERQLLAADAWTGDSRSTLAAWCLAGDLALGLGRCIRLLPSLAGQRGGTTASVDGGQLIGPLKEALRELVG